MLLQSIAFLTGWAWFDAAKAVYPAYDDSLAGVVALAVCTTAASTAFLALRDEASPAASERAEAEMRLVANALAMMQGGAWCDAVSGAIDAVVELEAHNEVLAALAVTLAVSAAILSAQRWCLEK